MLMYDQSFVAVMTATKNEATALGARDFGSEHVLLGLLASDDDLTQRVVRSFPSLTTSVVRDAVHGALDDAPHLARLGISAPDPAMAATPRRAGGAPPRNKHTPELQSALNQATAKWGQLRRTGALPKERKVGSAILWLAVLEPAARASRLLHAMDVDADSVRTAVLGAMVPAGAGAPEWPTEPTVGPFTRLVQQVFSRTNVAR
ncbi:hypothetical protein J1G43_17505 [Cellulomonas sp. zg-ZUI22]|uniref:Clp protease N-terminal domain-containing protein n=1 Tax=Cellulomonas sp. zg-ZUI22 TaxID=2816955 RepID=UPI001A93BD7E|nr:Clp protease N-terminal domain-containing protein [Cellulomonas sp. zg-ZUI22]MBO0901760.1 hypothetical protein [Cellulomonas sp. zg-ZUI22]